MSRKKTSAPRARARKHAKAAAATRTPQEIARAELERAAKDVLARAAHAPDERRPALVAALLVAAWDGAAPPPLSALAATARRASVSERRREGVGALAALLVRRLSDLGVLDDARALPLARALAPLVEADATLFVLEHQARAAGRPRAARVFARALDARSPTFRAAADAQPVTRALMRAVGLDPDLPGLSLSFGAGGALTHARSGTFELTLGAPGRGTWGESGKRGGYGFAVSERYERGAVHGTFFSPWHDGEPFEEKKPWLVWALEHLARLRDAAARAPRPRQRSAQRPEKKARKRRRP